MRRTATAGVVAVVAFYLLGKQDLWVRVAALIVLMVLAAATFFTSEPGKQLIAYGQDSVREVRKVVWPTRRETLVTTGLVLLLVVFTSLFFVGVDTVLRQLVGLALGFGRSG